jgi:hypothetical protein
VDAAIDQGAMKMRVGIVIRDAIGWFVVARAHQIPFIVDPLMAEAIASWHAISFGMEMGTSKVILEGNSLVVMSALMKKEVCTQAYGQVIEDKWSSFSFFSSADVNHVKRGANMVAPVIAKSALSQPLDQTWRGECHFLIHNIVLGERE